MVRVHSLEAIQAELLPKGPRSSSAHLFSHKVLCAGRSLSLKPAAANPNSSLIHNKKEKVVPGVGVEPLGGIDTRSCCTTQFRPNGINNLARLCNRL
jgi:hypothetical protein